MTPDPNDREPVVPARNGEATTFATMLHRNLVYLPVVYLRGQNVPARLRALNRTQFAERSDIDHAQYASLTRLIERTRNHVPYIRALGLAGRCGIGDASDLRGVPFVAKSEIQKEPERFRSNRDRFLDTAKTTGGSTGVPVTILKSRSAMAWELAGAWRGYSWAGVTIGDSQARFWGVPFQPLQRARARLIDFVCNRVRLPAFAYSSDDFHRYYRRLTRLRPRWFYGYVSHVYEFASFCLQHDLRFDGYPRAVITTAEVLGDGQRDVMQRAFGAQVYNEYGCGEVGTIAHECDHGRLHVNEENVLVEIVDAGGESIGLDQSGEIVVTDLRNEAMPLIRYRLGDLGELASAPCPCGRTLRVLKKVYGRQYDVLVNREGQRFHGEFVMYIFEDVTRRSPAVTQFQVRQLGPADFSVRIVAGRQYGPETEREIVQRFRTYVDPAADVKFELVDAISREASGKIRLIIGMPAAAPEKAD